MRLRRHPGQHALNAWLSTGAPTRVGRHVDACEQCLATLEQLTSLDDALVAGLGEVVAPPRGIEGRTATAVERRLRDEDALLTLLISHDG